MHSNKAELLAAASKHSRIRHFQAADNMGIMYSYCLALSSCMLAHWFFNFLQGKAKFTIQEMTEISPLLLQEKRLDSLDYRTSNAGTSRRIRSFKAVVNQAVDATCTLVRIFVNYTGFQFTFYFLLIPKMKEVVKVPQCGEQEVIGFLYPAKLKIDASSAHDSLIKQLISQNNLNHCHWLQCNLFCSGRYGNNILDFIMNQFQPPCWFEESLCIYCN